MNTYTIASIKFSKEVQGKFGPQFNIRFTTNETGEKSISGFFSNPLKEGQQIEGEIVEKPGTNKDGQEVIYHNFQSAKKTQGGGMSQDQYNALMRELHAINTNVLRVFALVNDDGLTSAGTPVPDFTPATMKTMEIDPEMESLMESAHNAFGGN